MNIFIIITITIITSIRRRRLCFYFGLFVCLSVCLSDNWKSCERILMKFFGGVEHGPGTNEFNFGDDLDHHPDPGVQSPKSGFTGLSNYQRILMKFYRELGCGLETNWLHFGDDPHHYPNPGVRSGSRSGFGKNWHSTEVCALSTSSYDYNYDDDNYDYYYYYYYHY